MVRVAHDDAAAATIDLGGALTLEAYGAGSWGDAITASVEHPVDPDASDIAEAQGVEVDDLFTLTVALGDEVEVFRNVTVADGPRASPTWSSPPGWCASAGSPPADRPRATTR